MRLITPIILLSIFFWSSDAVAQRRPVSMIHNHAPYNYTIVRYVPVWEVESKQRGQDGLLGQHRQFFRNTDHRGLQALKDMLYSRGMVPMDIAAMDAETMESRLSNDRFSIYYRIQYRDHSIFLAHLNGSPVRSVIPFLVNGGRWTLDPDFADTEFYELLSNPDFDPYMGTMDGRLVLAYGFEELPGTPKVFHDYSGRGNHASIVSAPIVDGRFGGALKLSGNEAATVTPDWGDGVRNGFAIDFHLQVAKMVYNTEKNRTVWSFGAGKDMIRMETANGLLRVTYPVGSGIQQIEWPYTPDVWSLLSIEFVKGGVTVRENGEEIASSRLAPVMPLKGSTLRLGGTNGVKANMDELRITVR